MSPTVPFKCQICDNINDNLLHKAKEMLFGFQDEFEYVECGQCGCVQIKKIPEDIEKYYPKTYWNEEQTKIFRSKKTFVKRWLSKQKTSHYLGSFSILGALMSIKAGPAPAPVFSGWDWVKHFRELEIDTHSTILDVGCGTGDFLSFLWNRGFSNLQGVDIGISHSFDNGQWKVHKGEISDLHGKFDLIMMHHSLEHMQNQADVLKNAHRLLTPQKYLVVRIPVAAEAWERYNVNWVQLDPPRHFFIHTIDSIRILASRVGFEIKKVEFDSTEFQFWASEQYKKGIPLHSSRSYFSNAKQSTFTQEDISTFKQLAEKLNKEKKGDQVCLYLKKI